jgi:hypothetical protein
MPRDLPFGTGAVHDHRTGRLFGAAYELRDTTRRVPARANVPLPDVPGGASGGRVSRGLS